jgi:hypothetical protein
VFEIIALVVNEDIEIKFKNVIQYINKLPGDYPKM